MPLAQAGVGLPDKRFDFVALAEDLEALLGFKVDLVSRGAIKPNRWKYVAEDLLYV